MSILTLESSISLALHHRGQVQETLPAPAPTLSAGVCILKPNSLGSSRLGFRFWGDGVQKRLKFKFKGAGIHYIIEKIYHLNNLWKNAPKYYAFFLLFYCRVQIGDLCKSCPIITFRIAFSLHNYLLEKA
jgi:hypothetical protein